MKTIFSEKIQPGDELRIIAPSSSAASMKASVKRIADKRTKELLGLKVTYSKNAFEKDLFGNSSIDSRVKDLHDAFRDKKVKGIACVRGGYNANTLLPYLDWELIRKNPKPIWGFSDITVLSNAIYAKTGLVTYIGPNYSSFGMDENKDNIEYMFDFFKKCLMSEEFFNVTPSKYIGERRHPFRKNKGYSIIQNGTAEGVLIGGHLSTINLLQGTEYMPNLQDVVLFIEDDDFGGDQTIFEFERNLESLLQLPSVSIKGIILGRFQKDSKVTIKQIEHLFESKKLSKNIPIVADANFGHTQPIFTFPVGGVVRIKAKSGKVNIEILRH